MTARVIALGNALLGDDGIGPAVLERLRQRSDLPPCELHHAADPSDLVTLLRGAGRVILIDAVVGPAAGSVVSLTRADLLRRSSQPVSSHGLDVASALDLYEQLLASPSRLEVTVVGVAVDRPGRVTPELAASLEPAVARAAERVASLLAAPAGASD